METFESILEECGPIIYDQCIHLGPCSFRLLSNREDLSATRFFCIETTGYEVEQNVEYELWCYSLEKYDPLWQRLSVFTDKGTRSQHFQHGYYVTDHFGSPFLMISREKSIYIFGKEHDRIIWPYFVKYFLMLHAEKQSLLHLKAAAVAFRDVATLIVGRGGGGKTVLLTGFCLYGANFLSNSHVLISEQRVQGVKSKMRYRLEGGFDKLKLKSKVDVALNEQEVLINPFEIFSSQQQIYTPVKNICIVDYQSNAEQPLISLNQQDAYQILEEFALSLHVYRLEEDLLDSYHGDYRIFASRYRAMKQALKELVEQCQCVLFRGDIYQEADRRKLFQALQFTDEENIGR